ncbi:hypothetical protein [Streptomyces sp. NPDC088801]|uniref:hypothetical protein n=1 Tax=Streptomyces sp. NPDC088801 TaxID=3365903 RepID=UPI0037F62044
MATVWTRHRSAGARRCRRPLLPGPRGRPPAAEADVVLAAVPANLMRVLTLVGLDRVFTLRPDSSAAS